VYAAKEGENLVPTSYIAGKINPTTVGLTPNLHISPEQILVKRTGWFNEIPVQNYAKNSKANQGLLNNIVIFIRFAGDSDFSTSISTPEEQFNTNPLSMRNYFKSSSYNQLEIISHFYPRSNGGIILSYQDINSISYYRPYNESSNSNGYQSDGERTNREHGLLVRAVNAVKSQIPANLNIDYNNDGLVDNICFIVKANPSGWSGLLWPHRWSLYTQTVTINGKRVWDYNFNLSTSGSSDVSTLCHEMFHTLGAPDLYHYNYDGLAPVGKWDLMESNINPPQHSGAYMKFKYGNWLGREDIIEIPSAGTYTLYPLASGKERVCYKIASEEPSQYYYLEYRNRNSSDFESNIPGNGLLIYRINSACNGNASFDGVGILDEVYIFRPDGYMEEGQYGIPVYYNGSINDAHFSNTQGRDTFNLLSNPYPFLADGTVGSLDISGIIEFNNDSLRFIYNTSKHLDVSNQYLTLPSQLYQTVSFAIESNTRWNIHSTGNLFTLNKTSGAGNDTITLRTIGYNSSNDYKYDTLTIRGVSASIQKVYIKQDGFSFSISSDIVEMTREASEKTVTINSTGNWSVANFLPNWLMVTPELGTNGETDIAISVQEFTGVGQRNHTVFFTSGRVQKQLQVVQTDQVEIPEISNEYLKIYPNPTYNILYINNEDANRTMIGFILSDVYGRIILQNEITSNSFDMDVKKYEAGIYLLKIQFNDHSTYTSKIVKR